jgi:adenylate cyclase
MSATWHLRVYARQQLAYTAELIGPAEIGRQSTPEEALYSHRQVADYQRVVIASRDEKAVSRQHALLEPLTKGGFQLTNLSSQWPIGLPDGKKLEPQASCSITADALLTFGDKSVRIQRADRQELPLQGLPEATLPPGQSLAAATPISGLPLSPAAGLEMKALLSWLQATMDVLQSAASSADFFQKAASAVVDLVNLDFGRVLLLKQNEWQVQAVHAGPRVGEEPARPVSHHVLGRVRQEKRTFREVPAPSLPVAPSLREVDAVVAAPILDRDGVVIGALYGDRRKGDSSAAAGPITEVEAGFVELLARGVAAGLARLEQEEAALAARVQFEQFFTPKLSQQLLRQPDLLKGCNREVSILFCDIRGFSRLSERLGAVRTVEWVSDVMGVLSECVLAHDGVLVDYIGDELMAMWGAPEAQPEHARLACHAALDMLHQLPQLNDRWQAVLQEPMEFGIGINTGLARVGNTGSPHKLKYGPLGPTVNLASRVQGATKYLKSKLLITGSTQAKLDGGFSTRRLCRVRVVNIAEPVTLHELVPNNEANWPEAKVEYETALKDFENKNFSRAAHSLGNWRLQHPSDAPALMLLYRAVQCMVEEPTDFDPVWVLPGK